MSKKEIIIALAIILIIFFVGFILRVESTDIPGVSVSEKAFYEDDHGLPYMYELDSYYNYRLTENYLSHGYIGDTLINGKQWDVHSYYPPGVPMDYPPLIAYLGALFYKVVNIFGNVPLLVTCFWLPAFIAPLAGVIAYLFIRRFTNDYGAAAAGILMITAPYYFIRTVPGWYDTDMFNIIFPLLVVWFFVEAVEGKNTRNKMGFTVLAAISMALFALAWNGWQYQFFLLIIFSSIYIIWRKLKGEDVKNLLYIMGIFVVVTFFLVVILSGYLTLINLLLSPLEYIAVFGGNNPWMPYPNVYTTVSELSKPSAVELISGVGVAFFGGIFGFIWILRVLLNKNLKKKLLSRMSWFFYLFLVVWTVTGLIALTKGGRFILMVIPPLVISTGIMVGIAAEYLNNLKNSERVDMFKKRKNLINVLSVLLVILIALPAFMNVYVSNVGMIPGANDDLWAASQWINDTSNTSNDTVIISGWSWGHLYTAIADRPVVFDGRMGYLETLPVRNYDNSFIYKVKSPSSSREYWIEKAFSSNNESLSVGIFRMLATSGDAGYLEMDKYTKNNTKSVEILNNILGVDNQTALMILKSNYGINDQEAQNILYFTHPSKPRPFVIVTNDGMISKGFWTFYFGNWDFNKANGSDITYSVGEINYTTKNILNTTNGVVMNMETGNITWNRKVPYCVLNITNGTVKRDYMDKNSDFCIVLLMDNNESVVMDRGFEESLFTKLVMDKSNTMYLKSIFKNRSVTVWKIT